MTSLQHVRLGAYYVVALTRSDDFDEWRDQARRLLAADVPPDRVAWTEPGGQSGNLFSHGDRRLPPPADGVAEARVSRKFVALAKSAILHRDAERFGLLYRLVWRLRGRPALCDDAADPDVRKLEELARTVRRDIHKMRAFVRFRGIAEADGSERFVAWFEPAHHILRANAAFFVNRFTQMAWSILTPEGSLHWDGASLAEGPPARREDAPGGDPAEELWRKYYASIFNPARLKVGAMLKEMPRKYWKNMPEAALIPELVAGAQAREAAMVERGASLFEAEQAPASLAAIATGVVQCTRCPIGCNGTRAVMGEGEAASGLMIVGEQPGDVEEQEGRPFVGPAGRVLMNHLEQAGVDRAAGYVTNAVKHFKFVNRGKRRLHQSPTAKEIDICRWWLDGERSLVQPKLVLALGASAARGVLGKTVSVQKSRGEPIPQPDGSEVWITTHPSYLLRLDDAARSAEEAKFAADLAAVQRRLRQLA
ncbi:UdgX family uracil-DNA binding protein [Parablastomonas sp. CN1-191]|uniref:UdgX family uracil-DNA binding protein n=1 Tax=Parablastomonas sp. CN1-191 TaxID=3400908 RepID=UPI003BF89014